MRTPARTTPNRRAAIILRRPHVIVCESATLLWLMIESANPYDFAVTTPGAGLFSHGAPPLYFTFATLAKLGLPHATTTRHCPGTAVWGEPQPLVGPEAVAALASTGLDLGRLTWARQMHGADVARATARGGFAGRADVLVTTEPSAPLAIFTADCLPVTICDPEAGVLGLAHVGWRGTVRGAAQAAVDAVVGAGGRADRLAAAIGPSIGPCCYEVDAPVVSEFRAAYPSMWERWARPAAPGRFMLDLWMANEALVAAAGVDPARIDNPRLCTACHPDLLYSYRKGNRGRLVTFAALP